MKRNYFSSIPLALAGALLISTPVFADKINCGKIDDKDRKEECKDIKHDNKDKDLIDNGRVKCRNIENDKLRKECREKKFD